MNNKSHDINEELLTYQTQRLKELISEMVKCCEDRKLYEANTFDLNFAEIKCLMLFEGERYLTTKGIAQKIDVAKSRVTKIIDGLINRGFVERIYDPKDARIKLINLTAEGQKKAGEVAAFQKEIHQKILLELTTDERKNMLSYLDILRSAMEAVKANMK